MLEDTEPLEIPVEYPLEPERLSPSIIFLFPFIAGAISVSGLYGANYVVIGLGVLCTVALGFDLTRTGLSMPREATIFICFMVWASLGISAAYSIHVFLTMYSTMLQLLLMVFVITHFAHNTKMARGLLFAALIGAMIMALSAYTSGEYRRAEEFSSERVAGFALNANRFSMTLVYTTGIVLYFFKTAKSWLVKGLYVAILLAMTKLIIASGSRAGFIGFVMLGVVWYCLSYLPEIKRKPAKTIGMFFVFIIGMVVLFSSLSNTPLFERLKSLTSYLHGGLGGGSIEQRHAMTQKGIAFIVKHPVIGIGLSQFTLVSGEQQYSHNDYIEVFCSTGVIGGLLYYSLYIPLYLRLRRIGKMLKNIKDKELVCLGKTMVIVMCISSVSVITYSEKQHWILLSILIGWTFHIERELTGNNTYVPAEAEHAITEDR